jgi:hypothetical protein
MIEEPTTKTYYFGIPLEYAHDYNATTLMFAFEVYGKREVRCAQDRFMQAPADQNEGSV